VLALSLWSTSSSCGDGPGGPYPEMTWGPASNSLFKPSGGGSLIIGDWFYCKNSTCAAFDDEGIRFNADGTWSMLNAPGSSLDPGEAYCEEQDEGRGGTYQVAGQILTVNFSGNSKLAKVVFVLKGNDAATASIKIEGQDVVVTMRRVAPSRSSGHCQYDSLPSPIP